MTSLTAPAGGANPRPRRRWTRVLAGTMSCLVLAIAGFAGVGSYYFGGLMGNIRTSTDGNFTGLGAPASGQPINILLMGSDSRSGKNAKGHGNATDIAGARSDTTILLHVSGDRQRAMAVSIPRDSQVDIATCKGANGESVGGYRGMFNSAFDLGGPGCTAKTVQELTGLPINHYVVVDFTGFKKVVDALDGVDVCMVNAVDDPLSKLSLPAGHSTVRGEQALAFVRARHNLGDGSDIDRIARQQEFLSSAMRKATSTGVLTSPTQLYSVLDAVTSSLTTDESLNSPDALMDLAITMSALSPSKITFATVPWQLEPNGVDIAWVPSQAQQLWDAMKQDAQWPPAITKGTDGQPLTAAPAEISVRVQNGTSTSGAGAKASALLTSEGYQVSSVGNASAAATQTTVVYDPDSAEQTQAARTLSYATGAKLQETSNGSSTITLIVGSDFAASVKPVKAMKEKSSTAAAAKPRTAQESICAS